MEEEQVKDRISNLPDEITSHIISFLSIKDAVATSILSRRFRHQWEYSNFKSMELYFDNYSSKTRMDFLEWVNHIIYQYQGSKLDQLVIGGHKRYRWNRTHIPRWILFALEKKVTTLNLDLPIGVDRKRSPPLIFDPQHFPMPCFENVVLSRCYLSASSLPIFMSIRFLSLKNLPEMGTDDFESIFTTCTSLEKLRLENIALRSMRIVGDSIKLKCLEIFYSHENYCQLEIKINAPQLRTFIYYGWHCKFSLESTSKLVEFTLSPLYYYYNNFNYALFLLGNKLIQLETLTLAAYPQEVELVDIPILQNLKVLTLEVYVPKGILLAISRLLKASPILQKFYMHVTDCNDKIREEPYKTNEAIEATWDKCNYTCLEEVYFSGFTGHENEFQLLQYLLKTCSSLKQITIDPRRRYQNTWRMAQSEQKVQLIRDRAKQFGCDYLPSNIKFVVF